MEYARYCTKAPSYRTLRPSTFAADHQDLPQCLLHDPAGLSSWTDLFLLYTADLTQLIGSHNVSCLLIFVNILLMSAGIWQSDYPRVTVRAWL